ncbi:hypothetical protein CMQ_7677 [Grosmannia clavigera kw1407]|uniref:Uncharacterized protein n=1 Tax=Grosmannia clavigera (strain kw1407 / UAMH 11150) TaxID=655863 RepID=F0XQI6_GROCL|nr:uncharacterized protein CMQ_7677 [Grosmannia clavigera kw1407]EFX00675.1 hypothetical protein CMQ_7677 [Grosmannia clavigera kw1407]
MPDLNSVPPSPRVLATSRQPTSSTMIPSSSTTNQGHMPPPPLPASPSSMHVFPSNQMAVSQGTAQTAALPSPYFPPPATFILASPPADGPGVGPGPGPLRLPRPLTAAELHMQLEKEQEAVVNRLTRELTLLRAQNASVVSNASSTSNGAVSDASIPSSAPVQDAHSLLSGTTGFSIPSSAGRHSRTYSNTSTRSQTAAAGSTPSVVAITSPAPIRPAAPVPIRPAAAPGLSRQNSAASRRSHTNSPGPPSLSQSYSHSYLNDPLMAGNFHQHQHPHQHPHQHIHTHSYSHQQVAHGIRGATPSSNDLSPSIVPGTARYEETAFYRAELENVKRENEALKRRIRELERTAAAAASVAGTPASSASATVASSQLQQPQQQQQQPLQPPQPQHHHHQPRGRHERHSSEISRGRSESVSTTGSLSAMPSGSVVGQPTGSASVLPAGFPGPLVGGAGIAGRRESVRERVTSMLSMTGSVAGSVGVGVPEDELQVGESAASAGLSAQEAGSSGPPV